MTIEIALLCTVGGFLIGILTFGRNRDKDVRAEATRTAVIETKLDNIGAGITSIQKDFKDNTKVMEEFSKRLTIVEESTKSAHKRIDSVILTPTQMEVTR
ncbi:hypothetical protein [Psychrobacillus psychrodurans]|uniref:Uncharacterized protein n=1 Tax=Psychrobacillus psychrodurans TaxID=126157 RepID=A0A9X3LCH3_9BACI|nr:hypothetical protein [Psychrobacillus psychrodurans]MCZ8535492.1 hypothetical protein [Psychrobacillus psychrodurans]